VTTRRDFAALLDQYFGPAAAPAALPPAHADSLVDAVAGLAAGSHREGLSDLRIETAPARSASRSAASCACPENRRRHLPRASMRHLY
jgi:hypothetical protein